jgi:two-component system, chemotaxis family, CheB/CheR fusion protein
VPGKTTPKKRPSGQDETGASKKKGARPGKSKKPTSTGGKPQASKGHGPDFPIAGIGASAGGLEALIALFKPLPADSRFSFVVIQHLSSRYKSAMDQLLSHATDLPIIPIKNNLAISPGCIYLAPPEKFVSLINSRFRVQPPRSLGSGVPLPIDHFFTALAEARQEKAIGVILSGSASDGTLGMKAIKAVGGLTVVQSPDDATYASMPESAMATHMVDFILPADQIAEKLIAVVTHPWISANDTPPVDNQHRDRALARVFSLIQSKTGHDFSGYKPSTIHRRIARRMAIHQLHKLSDYAKLVARDPAEAGRFVKDMLIGVTGFFRDSPAFATLQEKAIAPLVRSKGPGDRLRVWVAGCASGEEAYSVAILIAEVMAQQGIQLTVQIFASDIDPQAIDTARLGSYPENIAEAISPSRLSLFFNHSDGRYHVKKNIRDSIVFSTHNLISAPPFANIDLLVCRNLLIYFKPELQQRILSLFHYALNDKGILFLGPSETIGNVADCFATVSLKHKLFRHRDRAEPSRHGINHRTGGMGHADFDLPVHVKTSPTLPDLSNDIERIILDEYAPPAVIIDPYFEILQFFGHTDPYLKMPQGRASFNILKMAREGLAPKLAECIRRALTSGKTERAEGVAIQYAQHLILATITVRPLQDKPAGKQRLIVLFQETPKNGRQNHPSTPENDAGQIPPDVQHLENELNATRAYLQATIEELETSNEAYKAANEELQSVNEELQSANEELETSREELQSTNEELVTINAEHLQKVNELTKANSDISNLMESTEIASLFLDLDLRVRRFTPAVSRIVNLRPADIGRPVSDITTLMESVDVHALAHQVLDKLERQTLEVRDKSNRWYEMRLMPYRTIDNVIDGVTIAFIDITDLRRVHMLRRITAVFERSSDAVTVQDFEGHILSWNMTAEKLYGWSEEEATHMHITHITDENHRHDYAAKTRLLQRGEKVAPFKTVRIPKNGAPISVWVYASTLVAGNHQPADFATFERPIDR